jgi:hypothetical protein
LTENGNFFVEMCFSSVNLTIFNLFFRYIIQIFQYHAIGKQTAQVKC